MRGKIAFIIGLGIGYVFGTRAGRERYEQIKRGAKTLWDSTLVKQGRDQVGGYATDVRASLQEAVIDAGKNLTQALFTFSQSRAAQQGRQSDANAASEPGAASEPPTAKKPAAKKPAPKTTPSTTSAKKQNS